MRIRLCPLIHIAILSFLFSCSAYRPAVSTSASEQSVTDYINSYKDLAITEMNRTGIPASITLAQGIIESDHGRSTLARQSNNHFGIKCHDDWSGPAVRYNDNRRNECFRKYSRAEASFYDHSDFLKSRSRYSFLFSIKSTDYKAWAHGLKKAGYATNPDYANMLIRTIEKYNLHYLDNGYSTTKMPLAADDRVLEPVTRQLPALPSRTPRVMENNRIQYIIVKDGDTRERLESEFQLLKWELSKYNELTNDSSLRSGQILYLQPKRDKAEPGKEYYNCVEGDSMYLISQRYGIKLKSLYEMNRMADGTEPDPGKKIWLRGIRPVD